MKLWELCKILFTRHTLQVNTIFFYHTGEEAAMIQRVCLILISVNLLLTLLESLFIFWLGRGEGGRQAPPLLPSSPEIEQGQQGVDVVDRGQDAPEQPQPQRDALNKQALGEGVVRFQVGREQVELHPLASSSRVASSDERNTSKSKTMFPTRRKVGSNERETKL